MFNVENFNKSNTTRVIAQKRNNVYVDLELAQDSIWLNIINKVMKVGIYNNFLSSQE